MDILFHPKKKSVISVAKKEGNGSGSQSPSGSQGSSTPSKPRIPRPPRPKPDAKDDLKPPPPEGPYAEFRLMSSALNGWKYDVMKFDSRKPVDIMEWTTPVKLNRKEPRRDEPDIAVAAAPQAVGPMLGPDGKPVIGMDGRIVMVDAEGRPIRPGETHTNGSGDAKGKEKEKDKGAAAKKRFQKKTKQVFLVPEATRQLRREERFPWIMEDSAGKEVWVGKMEEVSKSETHAMFMPAANDVFKFVPAHRWYKFQKRPHYHIPTLEEAESLMSKIQKNKDPERWLLRRRNGQGPSEATLATIKAERAGSLGPGAGSQSLGPGGRRLKTVDSGMSGLFGDDDDEEGVDRKRRVKRELGAEGDLDELDFEEAFADDEDRMEPDDREDEEAKELEERLKREYRNANKLRDAGVDESEDEEDENQLTGAGKNLQKTLRKLEKDVAYDDSDEEKNPYASSEEEEEEEEPPVTQTGPAIIPPEPRPARSASQTPGPANGTKTPTISQPPVNIKTETQIPSSVSRPGSPIPTSPTGHGGHLLVAKRATSPKVPKPGSPRPGSPLVGSTSPPMSRATSPVAASANGSRPGSPLQSPVIPASISKITNKRKAEESGGAGAAPGAAPKLKKRKAQGPPGGVELEDRMVIEWLRNTPNATTRDCIHHFTPYLTDEGKKARFTALVKEVAQLNKGVLVLRPAYRDSLPSPALTPSATAAA
ncbi:hypothetical protein CERSUDRAFT_111293 [Gelatoporia subvermispora B]|uniref:Transcription initiation factor IIF subunit alpha n=1 Tax=Ceriporiopsis subvermispora (strain B) TaxID=914234 RepID=M2R8H0_CERS8|nr:hypothetical protein CERSUDRAFT_111293 [Gelatoporia subvermispora B]